ncbi:MAG: hypothetical protein MJZ51_00160 [Bacteroidales bacterium]|nr:hypothetical protein [Bacteroidales bacterium]
MSITDFIVELLQKGTPVEVPGIGTIQSSNGTTLLTQVFNNDKSIVQYIAEKECVSYNIAEMMWKNYVDALTDKLAETHSHEFPQLGYLNFDGTRYSLEQTAAAAPVKAEEPAPVINANVYKKDDNYDPFAAFEQPIVEEPVAPAPAPEPEPEPVAVPEPEPVVVPDPEPVVAPEPVAAPAPAPEPVPEPVVEPVVAPEPAPKPAPAPVPEPKPEPKPEPEPVKAAAAAAAATAVASKSEAETIKNIEKLDKMPAKEAKKVEKKGEKKAVQPKEVKEEKKKKRGWIILLLLLLLLLAGVFALYRLGGFDRLMDLFNKKAQPVVVEQDTVTPEITLPIQIDTIETEPEEFVAATVAPAPKPKADPAPVSIVTTSKSKGAYDLIAGFYTSRASAAQMQKLLKADGCAAYIIEKNNGYYVSMGHAASYTEAQAKLEHVKSWYEGDVVIKNIESATSMI